MTRRRTIGILGGGKWGTSLGEKLGINSAVKLYSRELDNDYKRNGDLEYFRDMSNLKDSEMVLVAVPSFAVREVLGQFRQFYSGQPIAGVSKGIEKETGLLPGQIARDVLKEVKYAHLSGPSFAAEVANDLPVGVSLAMADSDRDDFQELISLKGFRINLTKDVVGVQLGGALKNVIAIAAGMGDGLGLGESFRAMLVASGLKEMILLGEKIGADEKTFYGPAGLGDLILTAMSPQSRNYQLGFEISNNFSREKIGKMAELDTYEGMMSAHGACLLTKKFNLDLPIIEGVFQVIYEDKKPEEAMEAIKRGAVFC